MAEEPTSGMMDEPMRANTSSIESMDSEAIPGLMVKSTLENGKIAKDMEGEK